MKNRLKELRKQRGLTLDAIAKETGVLRGTYNNYENGKTRPRNEKTWAALADFFGVTVPYIQGYGWSNTEVFDFLFFTYVDGLLNSKYGIVINDIDGVGPDYYEVDGNVYKYGYDFMAFDEYANPEADKDLLANSKIYLPDRVDTLIPSLRKIIMDQSNKFMWIMIPEVSENFVKQLQAVKKLVKPMFYNQLPILSDYAFMSTIDDKLNEYGIPGEYQIAEELSKEIAYKEISERKLIKPNFEDQINKLIRKLNSLTPDKANEFINEANALSSEDLGELVQYMKSLNSKHNNIK